MMEKNTAAAGDNGMDGIPLPAEEGPFREDLPTTLARVEKEMIVVALRATRGNRARAARALGISERLMGLRVRKYGIDPRQFRTSR